MQSIVYRFNEEIKNEYEDVMNILETIINIEINDKLYVNSNDSLTIHRPNTYSSIIRWWYKYNRNNSVEYLENLYNNIISSLNSRLINLVNLAKKSSNKKKRTVRKKIKKIKDRRVALENQLLESKKGIVNLMITYQKDDDIKKRLNSILDSILDRKII